MHRFRPLLQTLPSAPSSLANGARGTLITLGLAALNQVMNLGATTGFAIAGRSETTRNFLIWQIIGSAFGLGTQLSFSGLVRFSSVQLASAVGIGLAFLSAEIISAYAIFREPFTRTQWLGVGIVFLGLMLLIWGRS
jgi:drug/metabolite transporter (DMT)-like permease